MSNKQTNGSSVYAIEGACPCMASICDYFIDYYSNTDYKCSSIGFQSFLSFKLNRYLFLFYAGSELLSFVHIYHRLICFSCSCQRQLITNSSF